ncbi:Aminomethyltransferase folate-binding domain-containing protein [Camillea tinctor]|nr:Aminomethyltransferase folate-binding domain-containing protein [Camillea tinctor]
MQVIPRGVPRRTLVNHNVFLLGSITNNTRGYSNYNSNRNRGAQAPFVCPSCRRFRSQFRAILSPPRRSFSAATHASGPDPIYPLHPAAPPPPSGYAPLTSRSLISISGVDAPRFLQGLITSSITEPQPPDQRHQNTRNTSKTAADAVEGTPRTQGFYSGFLNATGRVLHDVFIYPDTLGISSSYDDVAAAADPAHAFLIEVDASQRDALLQHLRRHKLRSRIQIRAVAGSQCKVWQAWGTPAEDEESLRAALPSSAILLRDPRAPDLGYRVLSSADPPLKLPACDEPAYRLRRYLRGVPEGQAEIPRGAALPLEANLDIMGAIDFRKGCYVGQELTIRTRHRGVVRKRVLPCMLYDSRTPHEPPPSSSSSGQGGDNTLEYRPERAGIPAERIPSGLSIGRLGKKGRSAGTWLAGLGNVGLALCRLQTMTDVELSGEPPAATAEEPAAQREFVMRLGEGEGEGEGENGAADRDGEGEQGAMVKIKAFVPEWVRERLGS